jgi:two-component system phosphate regulon sensor histidine kinase PhoR
MVSLGSVFVAVLSATFALRSSLPGRGVLLLWLGGGIAAAFALAASLAATHRLSRRVRELTAAARAIRKRDFTRPVRREGDDEIGELADALDSLAADLQTTLWTLNRERDLLGAVLDGMTEGLLVVDSRGAMVRANPAFRALLGTPRAYPPGTPIEALRHPVLAGAVRKALATGGTETIEIETQAEPHRVLLVSASALTASEHVGLVAVFHDVTEIRRLEQVRRDFVANASHELRTPVAAIQGYTETLLGGALGDVEHSKEFIEAAHRHAERMGRLISDLLDLSRIESREYPLEMRELALEAALSAALDAVAPGAAAKRQRLEVAKEVGPCRIVGDLRAVEQVLTNLLDNAVKYTPDGGRISVGACSGKDVVKIWVNDTGPGIPADRRERIFERFYRIDAGRSRELGGTGLGLSIVRHLVKGMGGQAGVDSAPGGGASFWFTLPAPVEPSARATL